jgi:hypothetical protein
MFMKSRLVAGEDVSRGPIPRNICPHPSQARLYRIREEFMNTL